MFADGFTGVDLVKDMKDATYRPMGLAEGPDGSLYISESKKGKIWRVLFDKNKTSFDVSDLLDMDKRKNRSYIKRPDKIVDLLSNN